MGYVETAKLIILAFAIIGCVAAISVPDSATQGPNPQDIATPEPEYIDIDEPLPVSAPAPVPVQSRASFVAAPRPVARPIPAAAPSHVSPSFVRSPNQSYLPPGVQQVSGHTFNPQSGYQYRQVRRRVFYRRRY
ncbi:arabinogalactan protein 1 [Rhagoletis pomonella]|uniref:arabinogalactan protein 1 n=1 Tax=Rhagoletis pomonella TaxID=28610 RepID=UPI0017867253|nr:arabinogalactan protein 1 [Rhagoletis pomonella]